MRVDLSVERGGAEGALIRWRARAGKRARLLVVAEEAEERPPVRRRCGARGPTVFWPMVWQAASTMRASRS
jgi:hypothetical protein